MPASVPPWSSFELRWQRVSPFPDRPTAQIAATDVEERIRVAVERGASAAAVSVAAAAAVAAAGGGTGTVVALAAHRAAALFSSVRKRRPRRRGGRVSDASTGDGASSSFSGTCNSRTNMSIARWVPVHQQPIVAQTIGGQVAMEVTESLKLNDTPYGMESTMSASAVVSGIRRSSGTNQGRKGSDAFTPLAACCARDADASGALLASVGTNQRRKESDSFTPPIACCDRDAGFCGANREAEKEELKLASLAVLAQEKAGTEVARIVIERPKEEPKLTSPAALAQEKAGAEAARIAMERLGKVGSTDVTESDIGHSSVREPHLYRTSVFSNKSASLIILNKY